MITYSKKTQSQKIAEILDSLKLSKKPIITWQVLPNQRLIVPVTVLNISLQDNLLALAHGSGEKSVFTEKEVYFYCKESLAIFKAKNILNDREQKEDVLIELPEVVKILEKSDVEDLGDLMQVFDRAFLNESPNKNEIFGHMSNNDQTLFLAQMEKALTHIEGMIVSIQMANQSRPPSNHPLSLLDKSRLSFLVFSQAEYSLGEILYCKNFDGIVLEKPLEIKVMAIEEADPMGIQFNVSCAFLIS